MLLIINRLIPVLTTCFVSHMNVVAFYETFIFFHTYTNILSMNFVSSLMRVHKARSDKIYLFKYFKGKINITKNHDSKYDEPLQKVLTPPD